MPFYEYFCEACETQFELFQGINQEPAKACESCGSGRIRRVIFAPAVHFKGSGFYCTDYRDSGYLEAAKKEKPGAEGASLTPPENGDKTKNPPAPGEKAAPATDKKGEVKKGASAADSQTNAAAAGSTPEKSGESKKEAKNETPKEKKTDNKPGPKSEGKKVA